MSSILINVLLMYGGGCLFLTIGFITIKAYVKSQNQNRLKDYQHQITRSHSRILKLEAQNELLERKLVQLESLSMLKKYAFV
ncbi:MAG: hypothetical protein MUE72_02785 [Chitinophagaceae bacterium]|nr:hypothetical protein [Chitinophagaceae bacterium]